MLIEELTIQGLLSFGPDTPPLKLGALNLLVGPNGSGKSNLIEVIDLLRSTPTNITKPIRSGGGVGEWFWKGHDTDDADASIDAAISDPFGTKTWGHRIQYHNTSGLFVVAGETIEDRPASGDGAVPTFQYEFAAGRPKIVNKDGLSVPFEERRVTLYESVLSQIKDSALYPEFSYVSEMYSQIRLYREWSFGRSSIFRAPQRADMPGQPLEEDFSNLGLFLNHLRSVPAAKKQIIERLRDLYEGLDDFDVRVQGGTVNVFLTEGNFIIPARRLSDGTLRYLCLLAILCDPNPPPFICIEEPELGLHPDLLPKLADLMVEASGRTQLIVTTHSDILVDAMTERPECVVVVEKHEGATAARRLENNAQLQEWLAKYRLGQLWLRGQIGGTRW